VQRESLTAPLHAIHFRDDRGWAAGGNGLILRTDDGTMWVEQNTGKINPDNYHLSQNYPNPFNPSTKVKFSLPRAERVMIDIYNTLGQKIKTILNMRMTAGDHEIEFDAQNLSSGVYFYKMTTKSGFSQARKLVILK
jgi:hypothetical protein